MFGKVAVAAASGTAFGVLLCKILPRGWPLWKEAVAVAAICVAVYAVLGLLGRRLGAGENGSWARPASRTLREARV